MAETLVEERAGSLLAIPRTVERAAEEVVRRAFERLLSSDIHVLSAADAKRLLADDEDTEELTDAIQRFVAIATPVVRIALRGARFTRVPSVLMASSAVSIGVTVRNGVRELQAIAALLAYRFEQETGAPPNPALLQKLTLELYLKPRRTPDISGLGLPLAASPPCAALDHQWCIRSEHAWKDGEGARRRGAPRRHVDRRADSVAARLTASPVP